MIPIQPPRLGDTLKLPRSRPNDPTTITSGFVGLDSGQLLRGEREVVIRHGDQVYRLRHTRNDKLILTK